MNMDNQNAQMNKLNLSEKEEALLAKKLKSMENDPIFSDRPIEQMHDNLVTEDTEIRRHAPIHQPTNSADKMEPLKKKIESLERELGLSEIKEDIDTKTYRDSAGNETFFVKNITNKHIMISDIPNMKKIRAGDVVDLLKFASLEDIKKSRDLRSAIYGVAGEKCLQRLTEQEYYTERLALLEMRKKEIIEEEHRLIKESSSEKQSSDVQTLLPHQRPPTSPLKNKDELKPSILAKLGKLSLKFDKDPEVAALAMSSAEFIKWVKSEELTSSEIDRILTHPAVQDDYEIRAALLEKKVSLSR